MLNFPAKWPRLWLCLCLVIGAFPPWLSGTWALYSSEPLLIIITRNIPGMTIPDPSFSPLWITTPISILLLLWLWYSIKIEYVATKQVFSPASSTTISESHWLSPKDAFYKFGPRYVLDKIGVLIVQEVESKNKIANIEQSLRILRAKHYAKFGEITSGLTLPLPPKEPQISVDLKAEWNKLNSTIAKKELLRTEALTEFIKLIREGKLIARGFKAPKNTGDEIVSIKPTDWYGLEIDNNWNVRNVALGPDYIVAGSIAYVGVSISSN